MGEGRLSLAPVFTITQLNGYRFKFLLFSKRIFIFTKTHLSFTSPLLSQGYRCARMIFQSPARSG